MDAPGSRACFSAEETLGVLRALGLFSVLLTGEVIDPSQLCDQHFGLEGRTDDAARLVDQLHQLMTALNRELDSISQP